MVFGHLFFLLLCNFFLSTFTYAQFTQIGLDIDGENINDNSGKAVSLNTDGTILAIGAPVIKKSQPEKL